MRLTASGHFLFVKKMKTEVDLRLEMVEVGARLWHRGLLGAAEGNLSCRLDSDRLLCTPSGVSKGHMRPDDLVVIDYAGHAIGPGRPSSEIRLHLRFYNRLPEVMAVVHAHPITATAFACSPEPYPDEFLPESIIVMGPVAKAPFAIPGDEGLPDSIEPFLGTYQAILLANHGAVTSGYSLMDAYGRMETLERVAEVAFRARLLGGPVPLEREAIDHMKRFAADHPVHHQNDDA